jgi:hypothetical protein
MNSSAGNKSGDSDWDSRVLCSDGNCIGVIGSDGRCKECGKPYEGKLPFSVDETLRDVQSPDEAFENEPENRDENGSSEQVGTVSDGDEDSDWDNRVLCSDGNCIGVIGPDGRCKECGKPYESEPEQDS